MVSALMNCVNLSIASTLFFIIYLTGAVWPLFISARGVGEGILGLMLVLF